MRNPHWVRYRQKKLTPSRPGNARGWEPTKTESARATKAHRQPAPAPDDRAALEGDDAGPLAAVDHLAEGLCGLLVEVLIFRWTVRELAAKWLSRQDILFPECKRDLETTYRCLCTALAECDTIVRTMRKDGSPPTSKEGSSQATQTTRLQQAQRQAEESYGSELRSIEDYARVQAFHQVGNHTLHEQEEEPFEGPLEEPPTDAVSAGEAAPNPTITAGD